MMPRLPAARAAWTASLALTALTACGRAPAPATPAADVPVADAAAVAPAAALPVAAPERVVADFYAALASLRPSGAPTDAQRAALSPLLSAELIGLLQRADAVRAAARASAPTEKPPFTDGDIFSSLFEGPTGYAVGKTVSGAGAPGGRLGDLRVPVTLTHATDPAAGKSVTWTDTMLLPEENGRFVVADIAFGGDWDFANKGSLLAALRAGLGEQG